MPSRSTRSTCRLTRLQRGQGLPAPKEQTSVRYSCPSAAGRRDPRTAQPVSLQRSQVTVAGASVRATSRCQLQLWQSYRAASQWCDVTTSRARLYVGQRRLHRLRCLGLARIGPARRRRPDPRALRFAFSVAGDATETFLHFAAYTSGGSCTRFSSMAMTPGYNIHAANSPERAKVPVGAADRTIDFGMGRGI